MAAWNTTWTTGLFTLLVAVMTTSIPVWAGDGLLWKVTSNGSTAWLLGSVHYASESLYPLPPHVQQAFQSSDALVLEINVAEVSYDRMNDLISRHGMAGPDGSLDSLLSDEARTGLEQAGIDLAPYQDYRPWFLAVTLENKAALEAGLAWQEGLDAHFLKRAQERQMDLLELETLESQMTMYRKVGLTGENQLLLNFLSVRPDFSGTMDQVFTMWKTGDVDGLMEYMLQGFPQSEGNDVLYEVIIRQRNQVMAQGVAELLARGRNVFVVVGALHLVGPHGVPALLAGQGLTVERALASGPVPFAP